MCKLITLHEPRWADDGIYEVYSKIDINTDNINKVEPSGLDSKAITRITFNNGAEICVTETVEDINQLINK